MWNFMNEQSIYEDVFQKSLKSLSDAQGIDLLTPHQTDNYIVQLSALYGLLSERLAVIEGQYPKTWLELKFGASAGQKGYTDKMTDKLYDSTPDGQERTKLRIRLKSIEKNISALKGRLYRLNNEARNQM